MEPPTLQTDPKWYVLCAILLVSLTADRTQFPGYSQVILPTHRVRRCAYRLLHDVQDEGGRVWYHDKKYDEGPNATLIFVLPITRSCQLFHLVCSLPSALLSSSVSAWVSNQIRTDNSHPSSAGSSPNGWGRRGSFFARLSLLEQKGTVSSRLAHSSLTASTSSRRKRSPSNSDTVPFRRTQLVIVIRGSARRILGCRHQSRGPPLGLTFMSLTPSSRPLNE